MYTSTQDFTLACAAGSSGATVVRSATATSLISQRDAYLKAYGLARALAVEFLECTLDPVTPPTIYYNVEKTYTANSEAGYVTDSWTATITAGSVYSLVSQSEADTAAQTAATVQATQQRDANQRRLYYNVAKSMHGACTAEYAPYETTVSISSAVFSSDSSQAAADSKAQSACVSSLSAALTSNCILIYSSTPQTYTAVCGGGTVGDTVTVNYPAAHVVETSSQSVVDSKSLSQATSAATGLLSCVSGSYNVSQVASANCVTEFGSGWTGATQSAVVSAGTFFGSSLSEANSKALSAAFVSAVEMLSCEWGGGGIPP